MSGNQEPKSVDITETAMEQGSDVSHLHVHHNQHPKAVQSCRLLPCMHVACVQSNVILLYLVPYHAQYPTTAESCMIVVPWMRMLCLLALCSGVYVVQNPPVPDF